MTQLALSDDNWATLCAARKVPERKRRRYERVFFEINEGTRDLPRLKDEHGVETDEPNPRYFSGEHHDLLSRADDMLILCFVKEWSFEEALDEDGVRAISSEDYRTLKAACEKLRPEMMPDYSPDRTDDPKVLTSGSTQPPSHSSTAEATFTIPSSEATS